MSVKKIAFDAIGTSWEIEISGLSDERLKKIEKGISEIILDFDLCYSRFNKKSIVFLASKKSGNYKLPQNSKKLFGIYKKLFDLTNGNFTPLIGGTLSDAGYDADYSFESSSLTPPPSWDETFEYDSGNLHMKKPAILDFGAAGKGYLIDLVSLFLIENKADDFLIDAGGDIYAYSQEVTIGLENPLNFEQVIGTVKLKNASIASSSGNRRKWKGYHHIINPKTLSSPDNFLATWAIAQDSLTADAMSTALFLTDKERLRRHFDFEYLILYPDFSIDKSLHFNAELFYDEKRP